MGSSEARDGKVAVVVLAAGRSSRMDQAKQVALVDGTPMVVRAVNVAVASKGNRVYVVLGAHRTAVEAVLAPVCQAHEELFLLDNPQWSTGQASTVRCAVESLSGDTAAILFLPVDQPFVPVQLLDQLIDTWRQGALLAAPVIDGQPRGAPAIFDRSLFPELMALEGDTGARPLLQRHRQQLQTIPAEETWLRDIDTPADLAAVTLENKGLP